MVAPLEDAFHLTDEAAPSAPINTGSVRGNFGLEILVACYRLTSLAGAARTITVSLHD